jgi:dihydroneopterin aldolase
MAEFVIRLTGLKVFAHHGVLEFERQLGQEFFIDALVEITAGESDDLLESVSYAEVADALVANAKQNPVQLLETLAMRLANLVLGLSPRVKKVTIEVHKPNAPIDHEFEDVSVSFTAGRN